jgi:hypothetical protein
MPAVIPASTSCRPSWQRRKTVQRSTAAPVSPPWRWGMRSAQDRHCLEVARHHASPRNLGNRRCGRGHRQAEPGFGPRLRKRHQCGVLSWADHEPPDDAGGGNGPQYLCGFLQHDGDDGLGSRQQAGFTGEVPTASARSMAAVAADDWRARGDDSRNSATAGRSRATTSSAMPPAATTTAHSTPLAEIIAQCGWSGIDPAECRASIGVDTYVWAAQLDHPAPGSRCSRPSSRCRSRSRRLYRQRMGPRSTAFRDDRPVQDPVTMRELAARVTVNEDPFP